MSSRSYSSWRSRERARSNDTSWIRSSSTSSQQVATTRVTDRLRGPGYFFAFCLDALRGLPWVLRERREGVRVLSAVFSGVRSSSM